MASQDELMRMSSSTYWDERYQDTGTDEQLHEWFRSYNDLVPFFSEHLFPAFPPETDPKVLHLGSGDSIIPQEFAAKGYRDQLCVDFSPVVVDVMAKRHAAAAAALGEEEEEQNGGSGSKGKIAIEWRLMDVRSMDGLASGSIDVAFDKGTLDAFRHGSPWDPPDDVVDNIGRYLSEVHRVLRPGGVLLYVAFQPKHFIDRLVALGPGPELWDTRTVALGDPASFPYHGYIMRKKGSEEGASS